VLFVAAVFLSLNRSLAAVLRADNRPGVVGIAELTALVMTLILLAVLTPLLGILGAALASLVAYGTATLFMCVALRVAKPGHAPLVVDLGMST
jgi:Na+-driven multidrug efflux pump